MGASRDAGIHPRTSSLVCSGTQHDHRLCAYSADATARKTYHNLPYEQLHAPALGPAHPFSKDGMAAGLRNHRAGHVEDAHLSHFHFDDQYNTFMTCASGQMDADAKR